MAEILVMDVGGTRIRGARGTYGVNGVETCPTPTDYQQAIYRIGAISSIALDHKRPDAVGISIAGKLANGKIISAGKLEENGWTGLPFAEDVAQELGVSPDRIILLNDCAAGAKAEYTARQPKDDEPGAFMTLSTGFGAALYTGDGTLIPDEPGHYYLRPGAICGDGKNGHMEAHFSGFGIKQKFGLRGEQIPHGHPHWEEIKTDFHEGIARTLARYRGDYGLALQTIGFTGSVALGGPDMLSDLQLDLISRMGEKAAPHIEEAVYGEKSGLCGVMFVVNEALRDA